MEPTKIVENLYLGTIQNGIHHSNYGFDKIINLTRFNNQYGIPTVWINIDDSESSDLYSHLQKVTTFIHDSIENGDKVLVHCQAGISRSATVVIAYIMRSKRYSLQDAFNFVKRKRSIIFPNAGFRQQLAQFERWLNSTNSYF